MRPKKKSAASLVDLESEGWMPVCETERLDSYYHHCDVFGVQELVSKKNDTSVQSDGILGHSFLYGVSADSLGTVSSFTGRHKIETPPKKQRLPQIASSHCRRKGRAPEAPAVSLADGKVLAETTHTFTDSIKVRVDCSTKWATIRYTTDGTPVSEKSPKMLNGHALEFYQDTTLRVASWKRGWLSEEVEIVFRKELPQELDELVLVEKVDDVEEVVVDDPSNQSAEETEIMVAVETTATKLPPIAVASEDEEIPPPKKHENTKKMSKGAGSGVKPIKV